MICIKANIPEELSQIDDEVKAIYHSTDTVCFLYLKHESKEMNLLNEPKE
jgi:hypothetical protein